MSSESAQKGILIVISGFSGAGKGTLMKKLLQTYDNYALSICMTARQPRAGEQDGVEYFFTDKEQFEKKIEENGLIEYASYCGNYYGTPKAPVDELLAQGRTVFLKIEVQGAEKIRKLYPEAVSIFLMPPSMAALEERLPTAQMIFKNTFEIGIKHC